MLLGECGRETFPSPKLYDPVLEELLTQASYPNTYLKCHLLYNVYIYGCRYVSAIIVCIDYTHNSLSKKPAPWITPAITHGFTNFKLDYKWPPQDQKNHR